MNSRLSRIGLTALTTALTILAAYNRNKLDCGAQPIAVWIVGCLALLSGGFLVTNFKEQISANPRFAYWLISALAPTAAFSVITWSILGFVWMIQNILNGNKCLPFFVSITVLWGMVATHIAIVVFLIKTVTLGFRLLVKKSDETKLKKKLIQVYESKEKAANVKIANLIDTHKDLIEVMPLFEEESSVIKEYCTQQIKETHHDDECVICLAKFESSEFKTAFSCPHSYHFMCITEWLSIKPSCPYCREPFRPALLYSCRTKPTENSEIEDIVVRN